MRLKLQLAVLASPLIPLYLLPTVFGQGNGFSYGPPRPASTSGLSSFSTVIVPPGAAAESSTVSCVVSEMTDGQVVFPTACISSQSSGGPSVGLTTLTSSQGTFSQTSPSSFATMTSYQEMSSQQAPGMSTDTSIQGSGPSTSPTLAFSSQGSSSVGMPPTDSSQQPGGSSISPTTGFFSSQSIRSSLSSASSSAQESDLTATTEYSTSQPSMIASTSDSGSSSASPSQQGSTNSISSAIASTSEGNGPAPTSTGVSSEDSGNSISSTAGFTSEATGPAVSATGSSSQNNENSISSAMVTSSGANGFTTTAIGSSFQQSPSSSTNGNDPNSGSTNSTPPNPTLGISSTSNSSPFSSTSGSDTATGVYSSSTAASASSYPSTTMAAASSPASVSGESPSSSSPGVPTGTVGGSTTPPPAMSSLTSGEVPTSTSNLPGWASKFAMLTEVNIDGETYFLSPCFDDEAQEIPAIGSLFQEAVQIFCSQVVIGSRTIPIPSDIAQETTLPAGDHQVKVKPGPRSTEPHGSGLPGLTALVGLAQNSLVSGMEALHELRTTVSRWIDDGRNAANVPSQIEDLIGSARDRLGLFLSRMNQIPPDYPQLEIELEQLSRDPSEVITQAWKEARQQYNLLDRLSRVFRSLPTVRPEDLEPLTDFISFTASRAVRPRAAIKYLSLTGLFGLAFKRFSAPGEAPSGPEQQEKLLWVIFTISPTEQRTFKLFIKLLPDEGKGFRMDKTVFPHLLYQMYIATLTKDEAKIASWHPIVSQLFRHQAFPLQKNGPIQALPLNGNSMKSAGPPGWLKRNDDSDTIFQRPLTDAVQKLLSQKERPPDLNIPYLFDPVLGKGSTIFVLDTGINWRHVEFSNTEDRDISFYVVPNSVTLADYPIEQHAPEDIGDWFDWDDDYHYYWGHGTATAAMAAGRYRGIASNANLVVVKFSNAIFSPDGSRYNLISDTPAAMAMAFEYVFDYLERHAEETEWKAVICFSHAYHPYSAQDYNEREPVLKDIVERLTELRIPLVVPTGNTGLDPNPETRGNLDLLIPQKFGTADNSVITVGGVRADGTLYPLTCPYGPLGLGSLTTFAGAEDIELPVSGNWIQHQYYSTAYKKREGTSMSTAAVAGLIAYWMSLDELKETIPNGQWTVHAIKQHLEQNSYERWTGSKTRDFEKPDWYTVPDTLPVPYNGILDDVCEAPSPGQSHRNSLPKMQEMKRVASESAPSVFTTFPEYVVKSSGVVNSDFASLIRTACSITSTPSSSGMSDSTTSAPPSVTSSTSTPDPSSVTVPPPVETSLSCQPPPNPVFVCAPTLEDVLYWHADEFCEKKLSKEKPFGPAGDELASWNFPDFHNDVEYLYHASLMNHTCADSVSAGLDEESCKAAFRHAYKDCNNGGRGGTFQEGCVLYYTTSQCWSESLECNDPWNWPTPVVPGEVDAIARDACKKIVKDGGQLVTNKKDFQKWREPKASRVAYRWNVTWWRNTFEGDNGWCPFEPRGAHHVQGVDDCVDQLTAPFHRCDNGGAGGKYRDGCAAIDFSPTVM